MYKVTKTIGHAKPVAVINTDTMANVIIGAVTMPMLDILKDAGLSTEAGTLDLYNAWDFEVEHDVATQLVKLSLPTSKPIKRKTDDYKPAKKKSNKHIDAMDVLLGLAQYN